jgi:hypothetical protein
VRGDSVFRSAITDDAGEVDAGYLAMYVITMIVLGAIPAMVVGTLIAMWLSPEHRFEVQGLGVGIGSVCGGYGMALGAVGLFRAGDKDKSPRAPSAGGTP